MPAKMSAHRLERTVFETSRLLEYFTERELRYQTGRPPTEWPVVIVKELVDNALDACEDAGVTPEITVTSQGIRHDLVITTDLLRQEPRIDHHQTSDDSVTSVEVALDYRGILAGSEETDFYKWLQGYVLFNPHATFRLVTLKGQRTWPARQLGFAKWTPADPTSPWWYTADDLGRLIAAHAVHTNNGNRDLPLRELVAQFRGLSSTMKQKKVSSQFSQKRVSDFVLDGDLDIPTVTALLAALKDNTKPVKPQHLGVLGEENIHAALSEWYELKADCFDYMCLKGYDSGLPYVLEVAFARKNEGELEKYLGLNFAPTYGDPFAEARLQHATKRDVFAGIGLNALLAERKVQVYDPLALVVHLAYPRPRFRDRGKSGLQLE